LTDLLKNDQKWAWDATCQEAFKELKAKESQSCDYLSLINLSRFISMLLRKRSEGYLSRRTPHCLQGKETSWSRIEIFDSWQRDVGYFQTKKKLSPKQARWQEFLQEYDFLWEHKARWHNLVADAISWKMIASATIILASMSRIETNFAARMLEQSKEDTMYQRLHQQVLDGTGRQY